MSPFGGLPDLFSHRFLSALQFLVAAAPGLAHTRADAYRAGLLEQFRRVDPDRRPGWAAMNASHERQPVAQIALYGKRRGYVLRTIGSSDGNRLAFAPPLAPAAEQPLQKPRFADIVRRHRVGPEEIRVAHRMALARLRPVERRRVDHRDIVVRTRDCAVAASDAHVVLEIDFALGTPLDRAGRAAVHALRIVAMAARAGDEVLADLDAVADQAALAVQRLARLDTLVALDAQVQVHHQQRIGLDHAQLPASFEQLRNFGCDFLRLLVAPLDMLPHRFFDLRVVPAKGKKLLRRNLDQLALPRRQNARRSYARSQQ